MSSYQDIEDLLKELRQKNVKLWSRHGELHYRAPKGALTQQQVELLRTWKRPVVALLERTAAESTVQDQVEVLPRQYRAPLAFSQLSHWNLYHLGERPAVRQIASATRMRGQLNFRTLQASVAYCIRRHDALRTRILVMDGVPFQEISASLSSQLEVIDLSPLPEIFQDDEVKRYIEELVLAPIDVSIGPLFGMRLLKLGELDHVLIIAIEHIVSDGFSRLLLLRDIFTTYSQLLHGRKIELAPIPVQFAEYATVQRAGESQWIGEHGRYWKRRLEDCKRVQFPGAGGLASQSTAGWGSVSVTVGADVRSDLLDWCRARRTTLVMAVFTAYVAIVMRWCNVRDAVIQFQSNSRTSVDLENTVGYFSSVLYLRIHIGEGDTFEQLLKRITSEYCIAYDHADHSYIASRMPRPECAKNPLFNWSPQVSREDFRHLSGLEDNLSCSTVDFVNPVVKKLELDLEPQIQLHDAGDEIVGHMYFARDRYPIENIHAFVGNFQIFVAALSRGTDLSVHDLPLRVAD